MKIAMYQVDAFTDKVFRGNPAAVCPLKEWPSDEVMQAIAAENNLSETAFFVGGNGRFKLRWFTPRTEVDLCGHATLASAYVYFHFMDPQRRKVAFDTRSGRLGVSRVEDHLALDLPARPATRCEIPPALARALGKKPKELWASERDYMAVYAKEQDVRALAPHMDRLAKLDRGGVIVTAPGKQAHFVSRFFAPQFGIPEDPVTGSSHCTLVPYWSERLQLSRLLAHQVSARGGELLCMARGDRVGIAGRCALYLRGALVV